MSSRKLRSRPPGDTAAVESFISAAATETRQATPPADTEPHGRGAERYPWQAPAMRPDMTKVYNLRLPELALLKLKYIAKHTPDSMQRFCLDLLLPAIDAKIDELIHGASGAGLPNRRGRKRP